MFKNKKGNLYMSIMVAIIIFMVGMIILNFLKPEVTSARNAISCSTPSSITDGTKLLCLITDTVIPYYFIIVLSLVGGVITEKFLV